LENVMKCTIMKKTKTNKKTCIWYENRLVFYCTFRNITLL
jgi:hypothetical protein